MTKHIIPLIVTRIVETLAEELITDIPTDDPTRVSGVKAWRYQQDPAVAPLRISVQSGDVDDTDIIDGIVHWSRNETSKVGFDVPQREIGGGEMWYRRGVVRLELFFFTQALDEEVAREYAYTILGRVQEAMKKIQVHDLRDDFGEHAITIFSTASSLFQSGGAGQWIWRGKVEWDCLTERNQTQGV